MNRNNKYGPQSFEGIVPSHEYTPGKDPSLDSFVDLRMTKEILDKKKELTDLADRLKDELKDVTEKNTSQIKRIEEIVVRLAEIKDKLWQAGEYVDEMLEESKKYKNKGLELSGEAENQVLEFTQNMTAKMNEVFTSKLTDFDTALKNVDSSHERAIESLKNKYTKEVQILTTAHNSLLAEINNIKDKIVVPVKDFWILVGAFTAVLVFGGWGFYRFSSLPDNSDSLLYLGVAVIINFTFFLVVWYFDKFGKKDENENQPKEKKQSGKPIRLSLQQCLYFIIVGIVLVIYATWNVVGNDSPRFLVWLLPLVSVSNLFSIVIRDFIYRIVGNGKE